MIESIGAGIISTFLYQGIVEGISFTKEKIQSYLPRHCPDIKEVSAEAADIIAEVCETAPSEARGSQEAFEAYFTQHPKVQSLFQSVQKGDGNTTVNIKAEKVVNAPQYGDNGSQTFNF